MGGREQYEASTMDPRAAIWIVDCDCRGECNFLTKKRPDRSHMADRCRTETIMAGMEPAIVRL